MVNSFSVTKRLKGEITMKCMHCQHTLKDEDLFCSMCGAKVIRDNVCPNCGKKHSKVSIYCQYCGYKLKEDTASENDNSIEQKCPMCQKAVQENDAFCQFCGCNLKNIENQNAKTCPVCNNTVRINDNFCQHCGNKLKEVFQPQPQEKIKEPNSLNVASILTGIIPILFCLFSLLIDFELFIILGIIAFLSSIVGIVLGIVSYSKYYTISGIVVNGIIIGSVLVFFILFYIFEMLTAIIIICGYIFGYGCY